MRPTGREEEVTCPKCRRYVGTFERCPYCHARVPKRLAFRLLKWGGLTVAVLGILFLYVDLHSANIVVKNPPTVALSEIEPTMNMAQVYIQGKATFVKYYEDTRFLGMFVSDDAGNSIFIRAYDAETLRLIEMEKQRLAEGSSEPKFPAVGDIVTIRGQLRVRPDFKMMILQYAEGLEIERPLENRVTIAQMVSNPENFGEYQRLEIGWDENNPVKIISSTDRGWATMLTLYEMASESSTTLIVPKTLTRFGRTLEAKVGDTIRVKGAFQLYFTEPQLWLASWDDLR